MFILAPMSMVNVKVHVEPDHIGLSLIEVKHLAVTIAESYPNPGRYVSTFGFLVYTVIRTKESCTVEVTQGGGFHNLFPEPFVNQC